MHKPLFGLYYIQKMWNSNSPANFPLKTSIHVVLMLLNILAWNVVFLIGVVTISLYGYKYLGCMWYVTKVPSGRFTSHKPLGQTDAERITRAIFLSLILSVSSTVANVITHLFKDRKLVCLCSDAIGFSCKEVKLFCFVWFEIRIPLNREPCSALLHRKEQV